MILDLNFFIHNVIIQFIFLNPLISLFRSINDYKVYMYNCFICVSLLICYVIWYRKNLLRNYHSFFQKKMDNDNLNHKIIFILYIKSCCITLCRDKKHKMSVAIVRKIRASK